MSSFNVPRHLAFIMDGNGRWAKQRGLPRSFGHRKGVESLKTTVKAGVELGIRCMTFYGFSSENWQRPVEEVDELMGLMRRYLRSELAELHGADIRLKVIGDRGRLERDLVRLIEQAENQTANNQKMTVCIAISYGSQQEIIAACQGLAQEVASGRIKPEDITIQKFETFLYTADIPCPDLLIRTSGEKRISNFMLWQLAYSEMAFVDCYWPDFNKESLCKLLEDYQTRERRYGVALG